MAYTFDDVMITLDGQEIQRVLKGVEPRIESEASWCWPGTNYERLPEAVREDLGGGECKYHLYDGPAYRDYVARMETGSINYAKEVARRNMEKAVEEGLKAQVKAAHDAMVKAASDAAVNTITYDPVTKTQTVSIIVPKVIKKVAPDIELTPTESEADRIMRITREMCGG